MGLDMFVRTYDVDCAETDVVFAEVDWQLILDFNSISTGKWSDVGNI